VAKLHVALERVAETNNSFLLGQFWSVEIQASAKRVKEVFGSWLKALIEAGVLVNGTRETPRGIHTIALDGHTCLSLGEKTICDYLHRRGITHYREPKYPEGNYRADFLVGDVFIEYFGLAGDSAYDVRAREKMRLCQTHGIKLIALYPKDLITTAKLEKLLSELEQQTNVPRHFAQPNLRKKSR
jgi:hypothetical protein